MKPTGRAIAEALGVTAARVSQLVRDGMPATSIEDACAWYRRRVNPVRAVGQRMARARRAAAAATPSTSTSTSEGGGLLHRLLLDADRARAEGRFSEVEHQMRAILSAVPEDDRASVLVPRELAEALTAEVVALLAGTESAPAGGALASPLTDADAAYMGAFWFAVMAGEVRPAPGVNGSAV